MARSPPSPYNTPFVPIGSFPSGRYPVTAALCSETSRFPRWLNPISGLRFRSSQQFLTRRSRCLNNGQSIPTSLDLPQQVVPADTNTPPSYCRQRPRMLRPIVLVLRLIGLARTLGALGERTVGLYERDNARACALNDRHQARRAHNCSSVLQPLPCRAVLNPATRHRLLQLHGRLHTTARPQPGADPSDRELASPIMTRAA